MDFQPVIEALANVLVVGGMLAGVVVIIRTIISIIVSAFTGKESII